MMSALSASKVARENKIRVGTSSKEPSNKCWFKSDLKDIESRKINIACANFLSKFNVFTRVFKKCFRHDHTFLVERSSDENSYAFIP